MHTDTFQSLTADLRGLGGRRVWSLMISLFGDLVPDEGQSIDGPLLSAIMADMLVKPEAARVALHRLRNDVWIESVKSGRISQHSLSKKGRSETLSASPLIYADPERSDTAWQLILTPDSAAARHADLTGRGFVPLGPRVFVGSADTAPPAGMLCMPATDAPDWLCAELGPKGFEPLFCTLQRLKSNLPKPEGLSPVQIAVLRCLIVHNWRRLVLKHPVLPAPLVDQNGPMHKCHLLVWDMLKTFHRPRMSEIEQFCAAA